MHAVLLGDSTFDNRAYTGGGPDVVTHLNRLLVGGDQATLLALDGATTADVDAQIVSLERLAERDPPVSHVALSVGGNDLLAVAGVLDRRVRRVADAMLVLREEAAAFGRRYRALLDRVLAFGLPTVICTVYGGWFEDPAEAATLGTALRIFDHEILEAGLDHGLPVVDLRRVCTAREDYWNPIEPNERGGAKIAAAVLGALRTPRFDVGGKLTTVQGTAGMPR